jgi:hypothetical protein
MMSECRSTKPACRHRASFSAVGVAERPRYRQEGRLAGKDC